MSESSASAHDLHHSPENIPSSSSSSETTSVTAANQTASSSSGSGTPRARKQSRTNPMNVGVPHNWSHKWSSEEDERLLNAINEFGDHDWKKISELVQTRDAIKCMQRWQKGLRPDIVKGRWTEDEDRMLVYLVSQGHKNWGRVAENMPGRTSKQCRERWNNYLDPTLIHTPFTSDEDEILLELHKDNGNKWAHIARLIPGRTENAVKLRFNALMKNRALLNNARANRRSHHDDVSEDSAAGGGGGNDEDSSTLRKKSRPNLSVASTSNALSAQAISQLSALNALSSLNNLAMRSPLMSNSYFSAMNLPPLQGGALLRNFNAPYVSTDLLQAQLLQQQQQLQALNASMALKSLATATSDHMPSATAASGPSVTQLDHNDVDEQELSGSDDD